MNFIYRKFLGPNYNDVRFYAPSSKISHLNAVVKVLLWTEPHNLN